MKKYRSRLSVEINVDTESQYEQVWKHGIIDID